MTTDEKFRMECLILAGLVQSEPGLPNPAARAQWNDTVGEFLRRSAKAGLDARSIEEQLAERTSWVMA